MTEEITDMVLKALVQLKSKEGDIKHTLDEIAGARKLAEKFVELADDILYYTGTDKEEEQPKPKVVKHSARQNAPN